MGLKIIDRNRTADFLQELADLLEKHNAHLETEGLLDIYVNSEYIPVSDDDDGHIFVSDDFRSMAHLLTPNYDP